MQLYGLENGQKDSFIKPLNIRQNRLQKELSNKIVQESNKEFKTNGRSHKSKLGQSDFLKLLVAQLKHQDPLNPMKDRNFIAQMAQFSSLEQMTKMNKNIHLLMQQSSEASYYHLLNKKVSWIDSTTGKLNYGVVNALEKESGEWKLMIGNNRINVKDLIEIQGDKVDSKA